MSSTLTPLKKAARGTYVGLALALVACVIVQVGLAGLAVMSNPEYWSWHRTFVHLFEGFPILLLIAGAVGRARARILWWTAVPMVLVSAQYAFLALRPSPAAALHAVNALAIFGVAAYLAWAAARSPSAWKPEPSPS